MQATKVIGALATTIVATFLFGGIASADVPAVDEDYSDPDIVW